MAGLLDEAVGREVQACTRRVNDLLPVAFRISSGGVLPSVRVWNQTRFVCVGSTRTNGTAR